MMKRKLPKIIYFLVCFLLIFEQSGFAQIAGQLDISGYLMNLHNAFAPDTFRPLHLMYLSYDSLNNNFKLLLDKGSLKNPKAREVEDTTKQLLNYFFIGLTLPNDAFWVNLRPDSPDNIIDPYVAQTDVGKILLEGDLQLKKDTARFTSPETPEGKEYWDKLYQKAGEIFGSENITIPTLTRPWIVPDEIIIRETSDSAYIYKATLKVMLEQDYLKDSAVYNFKDDRLKELNEYSSQLIRELIIPKLTQEINSSKRYAALRQVYYSLIMAQWFKARFTNQNNLYSRLIDRKEITNLTSKEGWSKTTYFQAYQKSFKDGEYNIQQPISTLYGQSIRSYFSGGEVFDLGRMPPMGEVTRNPKTAATVSSIPTASSPAVNPNVVIGVKVNATDKPGELSGFSQSGTGDQKTIPIEAQKTQQGTSIDTSSGSRDSYNSAEEIDKFMQDILAATPQEAKKEALHNLGNTAYRGNQAALRAIEQLIPHLKELISASTSLPLKKEVLYALSCAVSFESQAAARALTEIILTSRSPEVQKEAFFWLGGIVTSGSQAAAHILTEIIFTSTSTELRKKAFDGLKYAGENNQAAARALTEIILTSRSPEVQKEAFDILVNAAAVGGQAATLAIKEIAVAIKERTIAANQANSVSLVDLSANKALLRHILVTTRTKITVRVYEVASIRATKGLINALGLDKDLVRIVYDGEITREIAKKEFSSDYEICSKDEAVKLQGISAEFHDQTEIASEQGKLSLPYSPFKYGLPQPASSEHVKQVKQELNIGSRKVIVLGSFSDYEIGEFMSVYNKLYGNLPMGQRPVVIIAPRQRRDESQLKSLETFSGPGIKVRNDSNVPFDNMQGHNVLILNTAGELLFVYALADLCVVGIDRNILEPASQAKPVLYIAGGWFHNFEARDALVAADGAREFNEGSFRDLMDNDDARASLGNNSLGVVNDFKSRIPKVAEKVIDTLLILAWVIAASTESYVAEVQPALQSRFGHPGSEDHAAEGDATREDVEKIAEVTDALGIQGRPLPPDIISDLEKVFGPGRVGNPLVYIVPQTQMITRDAQPVKGPVRLGNKIFVGDGYFAGHNNDLRSILPKLGHEAMAQWIAERRPDLNQDADSLARELERVVSVGEREKQDKAGHKAAEISSSSTFSSPYAVVSSPTSERASFSRVSNGQKFKTDVVIVTGVDSAIDAVVEALKKGRFVLIPDYDENQAKRLFQNLPEALKNSGLEDKLAELEELNKALNHTDVDFMSGEGECATSKAIKWMKNNKSRLLNSDVEVVVDHWDIDGILTIWVLTHPELADSALFELARKIDLVQLAEWVLHNRKEADGHSQAQRIISREGQEAHPLIEEVTGLIKSDVTLQKILDELTGVLEAAQSRAFNSSAVTRTSSSAAVQQEKIQAQTSSGRFGGIDFRSLPIVTQAIGNLSANIGGSSINRFSSIKLDSEWREIEHLVNSGITPSSERIKEYVQASCYKGSVDRDIDKVISCISDILRIEEERYYPTDPTLKDILVVLDSSNSTQQLKAVFIGR